MPEEQPFKSHSVEVYPVGHPLYTAGRVVVRQVENDGTENTTEYTLEKWAALQNGQ